MADLPTGTVTFLFTDLEGSTRLWEEHPEAMPHALARHDEILRDAVSVHHGIVLSGMGDGIAAVFASAPDAMQAMLDAQRGLHAAKWSATGPLRARMGVHSDEGQLRAPGEYVNRPLNRCARLMAIGHGGQMLVSDATASVARSGLPHDADLVDLGEHRLRDLAGAVRVFQLTHPELRADFPPLRSLDAVPGNLPRQVTTFVGREAEVAMLSVAVLERALVTLTGVGGVGKTRLAVQVAAEVVSEFPDGGWVCELGPVADPGVVWDVLASSLSLERIPGLELETMVVEYLRPKRLLLVLDNCEHLLDAAAAVVDAIGRSCSRVAVLATSREGLALPGEQIVALRSLELPAPDADPDAHSQAEAVQLFCDRAQDAKDDFVLTESNAGAVSQLCRRLDGIPLAIELAAARVRSLPPEDLVTRLDQRFKLLTRGSRAALERHQTLRNTIDWSYDLLGASEQQALNRLSVFAGGWDLAAAEAILADETTDAIGAVDVLSQLVDKSLVVVDDSSDRVRYRLLETVRQYAQERLEASGATAGIRRRHADHYVETAEAAAPGLRRRDQLVWVATLTPNTDNFRTVLDWAVEAPSPEHALRLVTALAVPGLDIGWTAIDWADTARAVPGAADHEQFPHVVAFAALSALLRGDMENAAMLVATADEAQRRLGTHHLWVITSHGVLALFQGDFVQAQEHAQAWVDGARTTGDPYEIAHALNLLGSALLATDHEQAIVVLDEGVAIARTAGISYSHGIQMLASVLARDEPARALALFDEAIAVARARGDRLGLVTALASKGFHAAQNSEWRTALHACVEAAALNAQFGAAIQGGPFGVAAQAFMGLGEPEPAAVLIGFADRSFERPGFDEIAEAGQRLDAALLEALGEPRTTELAARGAAMQLAEAVAYLRVHADRALGS